MGKMDEQIGGSHYTDMGIQPLEYSMANNLNACEHSVIKYVSRHRGKGGKEDLLKAIDMLEKLIEFEYNQYCEDEGCPYHGTIHFCVSTGYSEEIEKLQPYHPDNPSAGDYLKYSTEGCQDGVVPRK